MGLPEYLSKPVLDRLDQLEKTMIAIGAKMQKSLEEFNAVLQEIDAATTAVATELEALKDQLADQGLPSEVEEEIFTKLQAAASRLKGIAADPETPVPPV